MPPLLEVDALRIPSYEKVLGPFLVIRSRWLAWPNDMSLTPT